MKASWAIVTMIITSFLRLSLQHSNHWDPHSLRLLLGTADLKVVSLMEVFLSTTALCLFSLHLLLGNLTPLLQLTCAELCVGI